MKPIILVRSTVIFAISTALLAGCSGSGAAPEQYGANPQLPPQQRGLLPSMTIAKPATSASSVWLSSIRSLASRLPA